MHPHKHKCKTAFNKQQKRRNKKYELRSFFPPFMFLAVKQLCNYLLHDETLQNHSCAIKYYHRVFRFFFLFKHNKLFQCNCFKKWYLDNSFWFSCIFSIYSGCSANFFRAWYFTFSSLITNFLSFLIAYETSRKVN